MACRIGRTWVALVLAALAASCGSGPGDRDTYRSDLPDISYGDVGPDGADAPDGAGEVPDKPDAADAVDAFDPGRDFGPPPECTPTNVQTTCADLCRDLGPCEQCVCELAVGGGTCMVKNRLDGAECDDADPCTSGDRCQAGQCLAGETLCDCQQDEHCAPMEDGDACNGTLVCDRMQFPFRCKLDPTTVVRCSAAGDSFCSTNQCDVATGACAMGPAREGESCEDGDPCSVSSTCQTGACLPLELRDCSDGNSCTTDTCDPSLGCVRTNNNDACDDGDPCTEGDRCALGTCRKGTAVACDNGDPCDGVETCDRVEGCVPGPVPDCDDRNACTDDSCDPAGVGCVHVARADAEEGPLGDPRCDNGSDDDCDGKKDYLDPDCRFGITAVDPTDGPETGGTVVTVSGQSFDLVASVTLDGFPVAYEVVSPSVILVTMPAHEPARVTLAIHSDRFSHAFPEAFRFWRRSLDPAVIGGLTAPLDPVVIEEGQSTPAYEAEVLVPGLTDVPSPDPTAVTTRFGYGPRGTLPWVDTTWRWFGPPSGTPTPLGALKFTAAAIPPVGGYFDVAVRFSIDGGASWVYGDLDGTPNGYDPAQALPLAVFGVPRAGAVLLNEILWMGSADDPLDEWVELRNTTPAPYVLSGWKITGIKYPSGDLLLDDVGQVVNNVTLEPYGHFLVSHYEGGKSAVAGEPDIAVLPLGSASRGMQIPNTPTRTWKLLSPGGAVVDQAFFTANRGVDGDPALLKPERSMERAATPGNGLQDADWRTASVATGWDGDPRQARNLGTPRGPNSDVPACATDDDCAGSYPDEPLTACERRSCRLPGARCGIVPILDGGACDDGLFCTVGETCQAGACGNGPARDCADIGPASACSLDRCDEDLDVCLHPRDPSAVEGPAGSPSCTNRVDDDCDGFLDGADFQCGLAIEQVTPAVVPGSGGWEMTLKGRALVLATTLTMAGLSRPFQAPDSTTLTFTSPALPTVGDVDVTVTDGTVTAVLEGAVRVTGLDPDVQANVQWPVDTVTVTLGGETPMLFGRVRAEGITNGPEPRDPAALLAEVGYGPVDDLESDPWRDTDWTWFPAAWNAGCPDCTDAYEYQATLSPPEVGAYLVAFRFSVDGGYRFQFGQAGDLGSLPWDPLGALVVVVQTSP